MPEQWLSCVLEEIKSCDPSSTLCATRRSAGIPFYIQVPNTAIMPELIHFFNVLSGQYVYIFYFTPLWGNYFFFICRFW